MKNPLIITNKLKQYLFIGSISLASFMIVLDGYIVNIALPTIATSFNVGYNQAIRVILIYLLVLTSTLLLFGKLGDKIGLKKVFLFGYLFFTIGSFLCGISHSISILLIARGIQGLGGAMLYAMSAAMVSKFLPNNRRGFAFGILSTAAALGIMLGAPLGGFITSFLGWSWNFFINVPVGIIAIFIASRIIPNELKETKNNNSNFDIYGAIFNFLGLLFLIYAINIGPTLGWFNAHTLSYFACAIFFIAIFFWWEKRVTDPLINLSLLKNPLFTMGLVASCIGFILLAGPNFVISVYLQTFRHLSANQAGLIMMIWSLVYIVFCSFAGRLSDKIQPLYLLIWSSFWMIVGFILFGFIIKSQGFMLLAIYLGLMGMGYSFFMSPINNFIMGHANENEQGVASGMFRLMTNLGSILGGSLFGAIITVTSPHTKLKPTANVISKMILGYEYSAVLAAIFATALFIILVFILYYGKKYHLLHKTMHKIQDVVI